jgi:hypothetical protein
MNLLRRAGEIEIYRHALKPFQAIKNPILLTGWGDLFSMARPKNRASCVDYSLALCM